MVISVVVIAVSLCWQNLVHGGDAFFLLRKDNGDCLFCPLKSSAKNASHNHQHQARNQFFRRKHPAKAIAPFCFCDCIYEIHRWSIAHKLFLRACFVSVPKCTPYKKISTIGHYAQHDPILHSLPWTPYGRRQMSHGRICLWWKRPYCRSTKHKPQPTTGNLSVLHANPKSTFVSPFLRFPDTDVGSPKDRSVRRQQFLPCEASQWRTKQSLIRSVIH